MEEEREWMNDIKYDIRCFSSCKEYPITFTVVNVHTWKQ
jgi:hypothetical protein